MSWLDRFREALSPLTAVQGLARAEQVAALVPPDARYVTAGSFRLLADARAFVGGVPGQGPFRHVRRLPDEATAPQHVGLLVRTDRRLCAFDAEGERWSADLTDVTDLDGHRHTGFVVLTRQPEGLVVSFQTPVEVPDGAPWRTLSGMTNAFSGWDAELAPYGVRVHV